MRQLLVGLLIGWWAYAHAQEIVTYEYLNPQGQTEQLQAVLRKPTAAPNRKAVVLLHHAGGWSANTTSQYAEFLAAQGFTTLEPRMFLNRQGLRAGGDHLAEAMGALRYLAGLPDVDREQIAVVGLSFGAFIASYAGTSWAVQKYTDNQLRFARIALFYPVCWLLEGYTRQSLDNRWQPRKLPRDLLQTWTGVPMRIFAARDDDYNDRDPDACQKFADAIADPRQRALTSVTVYPATHGWDQRSQSFEEHMACKGRGCRNTNTHNPEVIERAKRDLLAFLLE